MSSKYKGDKEMTSDMQLQKIDTRIALLRSRGETMNIRLIRKLQRKRRAYLAKIGKTDEQ